MRLTLRFLLAFTSTSIAVLAIVALLRSRLEVEHFEADMRSDAILLASSLASSVAALPPDEAARVVAASNAHAPTIDVRWVALDGHDALEAPRASEEELASLQPEQPAALVHEGDGDAPGTLLAYAEVPPASPTSTRSAIEVSESFALRDGFARDSLSRSALGAAAAVSATSIVALVLGVAFIARPLGTIMRKLRAIAAGDLAHPLALRQHDEIGAVAREIDAMCERLIESRLALHNAASDRIAALEQLRRAERLATVGRLAAGVAHEIGTPLAVAAGRAQMIASRSVVGDEAVSSANVVIEQTQRIAAIVRQLLDFARRSPAQRVELDLVPIVRRVIHLLAPLAERKRVVLRLRTNDGAAVRSVDGPQVEQVLTNLVINALHATTEGGLVEVTLQHAVATPPAEKGGGSRSCAVIRVRDNGCGMTADTMAKIFEPFFTTKGIGEGTGLGLSVAHGIVEEHGGWIEVASTPGQGSTFSVFLPAAQSVARA